MTKKILLLITLSILFNIPMVSADMIHHDLVVTIDPARHHIDISDKISFPKVITEEKLYFILHGGLSINNTNSKYLNIKTADPIPFDRFGLKSPLPSDIPLKYYSLSLKKGAKEILLNYSGEIYHPITESSDGYAGKNSDTAGIISENGIYLAGSSYFIPFFYKELFTFDMTLKMPEEWGGVSQGDLIADKKKDNEHIVKWQSKNPVDEIYLISARFTEYQKKISDSVNFMAFLRTPDEAIFSSYFDTTKKYLLLYEKLIGRFPYSKFALVENFWETGYGMPSFTLLGEKVIRMPFIINSSYPHELLHNWWGNSVYIDDKYGNWCESLTTFLADHLIKEQGGEGASYRRSILYKYTSFVTPDNDIPLNKFRYRFNPVMEAVGYGKGMMMWNMLRLEIGDETFIKGLQDFFKNNLFKHASIKDLILSFNTVSGRDLNNFFDQWVNRTGAPSLSLSNIAGDMKDGEFSVTFTLSQTQDDAPFNLKIPAALFLEGEKNARIIYLNMKDKVQEYHLSFKKRPLYIEIDPYFDTFRRTNTDEVPTSLFKGFGAERLLIVLPAKGDKDILAAYKRFAEGIKNGMEAEVEIAEDKDISEIPSDRFVWILGEENIHIDKLANLLPEYKSHMYEDKIKLLKEEIPFKDNSIVLIVNNPKNQNEGIGWLLIGNKDAAEGLSRKLPHYGKYSFLAFGGSEPANFLKGEWDAARGSLRSAVMYKDYTVNPSAVSDMSLPKRKALAEF